MEGAHEKPSFWEKLGFLSLCSLPTRGRSYWTAYRRQGRRLRKIYLGPSLSVTKARLHEVADHLYTDLTTRIYTTCICANSLVR
jgi:hypothetical protein